MKYHLIIINGGRFGREVLNWALDLEPTSDFHVKGILDDRTDILKDFGYSVPILGPVEAYSPCLDDRFVCAIGDPVSKKKYTDLLEARGARFATLIHPTAYIARNVILEEGVIIAPLASISCDVKVGRHSTVGINSALAHDVCIGRWCQVSGNVGLNGAVKLEDGVFIGDRVSILPDLHVGEWAYIGAGSVVLKRVRPRDKVFGYPALKIGTVEKAP